MSAISLQGKIALVTGGGTGMGLMIAKELSTNGAEVYITGRRLQVLEKTASENALIPLQTDVSEKESISNAIKSIDQAEGKLDILVNNAGIIRTLLDVLKGRDSPKDAKVGETAFAQDTFEEWGRIFKTNTAAPYFVTMGFVTLLEKGARARNGTSSVINISSAGASIKLSPAGVNLLTQLLATQFALQNIPIRVNTISPGMFPSEGMDAAGLDINQIASQPALGIFSPAPLLRLGRPSEIGTAATFLASDSGEFVNGQNLGIDGGISRISGVLKAIEIYTALIPSSQLTRRLRPAEPPFFVFLLSADHGVCERFALPKVCPIEEAEHEAVRARIPEPFGPDDILWQRRVPYQSHPNYRGLGGAFQRFPRAPGAQFHERTHQNAPTRGDGGGSSPSDHGHPSRNSDTAPKNARGTPSSGKSTNRPMPNGSGPPDDDPLGSVPSILFRTPPVVGITGPIQSPPGHVRLPTDWLASLMIHHLVITSPNRAVTAPIRKMKMKIMTVILLKPQLMLKPCQGPEYLGKLVVHQPIKPSTKRSESDDPEPWGGSQWTSDAADEDYIELRGRMTGMRVVSDNESVSSYDTAPDLQPYFEQIIA
ncbi:hypothetical protein D9758_014435 [Tetrapyrgos nigripes]|uniref:NAD(P)-binding protein n=1 Tax=Tetrapyrgos nigripes TaxID=182062 RepID=A0A8H5FQC0_9AGAR|nr:hypothetical protein D9758_014435 [Tetrapyrgos nigripes]